MIRYEDIQERVERNRPEADMELLRRAYIYSAMAHKGQLRRSGEPYLVHPLEVSFILADLELDVPTVATGLLHDAVEDSHVTTQDIATHFGPEIAALVEGVTKLSRLDMASDAERQAENIRKMILAMVNDIRVILVKLADRLHNMRTMDYMPPEAQARIATETFEIYVPLANRLGLGRIRAELEDLAIKYTDPVGYKNLVRRLESKRSDSESLIAEVKTKLTERLAEHGIHPEITGRVKSIYGIYRKMQAQMIDVEQVYDIVAFRIIAESVKDCYGTLGIVHSLWPPVPGRIKDFIAMPKPNLYQSLHTTVMSEKGYPFEVQIRTREMHQLAEEGIAAHWRYKEQGKLTDREVAGIQWLRQVMEWQKEVSDSREFLKYVKIDLFPGEVYVFTPKGRVVNLPRGATPIDFAYEIHTEVGHHCVGARVNGRLVPLKSELHSGDIVEIMTQPSHRPSRDWLAIARTTRARSKIRAYLKAVERERSVELGRSLLDKELRRYSLSLKSIADEKQDAALKELRFKTIDELHAALGHGKLTPHQFIALVAPSAEPAGETAPSLLRRVSRALTRSRDRVLVSGLGDTLVTLARCCYPIRGDAIVGYITRGRGVSVHTEDCPNLEALLVDPERRIEVEWAPGENNERFNVGLRVLTRNQPGMLARVAEVLDKEKINIGHADAGVDEGGRGLISVVAEVENRGQVEKLIERIRRIDGVYQVERVSPARAAGQLKS
ncbi:MAG: bifunctional (p)ppGpp synthetase/guanosine-3',5'-bis(diphosphate) 3'-pyrophosphohydrolase [Acidobacteria bacterium]|nr:bifunctional (p)ppGpp synthetase/guanosine-3',5'-bis(diphosphate) 3'-pyrophosphohydrolase [Acidobacteriota bacterium]